MSGPAPGDLQLPALKARHTPVIIVAKKTDHHSAVDKECARPILATYYVSQRTDANWFVHPRSRKSLPIPHPELCSFLLAWKATTEQSCEGR